jgi:hypothetical protein
MLSEKSVAGPKYKDPMLKVKILVPIRVAGRECAVGEIVSMLTSDASFETKCCIPPRVEIL